MPSSQKERVRPKIHGVRAAKSFDRISFWLAWLLMVEIEKLLPPLLRPLKSASFKHPQRQYAENPGCFHNSNLTYKALHEHVIQKHVYMKAQAMEIFPKTPKETELESDRKRKAESLAAGVILPAIPLIIWKCPESTCKSLGFFPGPTARRIHLESAHGWDDEKDLYHACREV